MADTETVLINAKHEKSLVAGKTATKRVSHELSNKVCNRVVFVEDLNLSCIICRL